MSFIVILILLNVPKFIISSTVSETICEADCNSNIYCQGELLKDVQLAQIFKYSKTFIDMKLLRSEEEILKNFYELKSNNVNLSKLQLEEFVKQYFALDTLENCELNDFTENPKIVNSTTDENYREWILKLHNIWKELAGKVSDDVKNHPDRHSYLYIPNCFIKAGGFYTETYYWDSYWIVRGLLLSEMFDTAKGVIENMFWLIERYGTMLNGNRKYYLKRSQPPLLGKMVAEYFKATNDEQFLNNSLPYLDTEFQWWQNNRIIQVHKNGKIYDMAVYNAASCTPRPEGFFDDYQLAQKLSTLEERTQFYTAVKSAAESGWDFSSRYERKSLRDKSNSSVRLNLDTQNFISVDLNSILQENANRLSEWYNFFERTEKADHYRKIADDLLNAIDDVLWDKNTGVWLDWDLITNSSRNNFYVSNLTPLWTGSYKKNDNKSYAENAVQYLVNEKVIKSDFTPIYYGVPASMTNTNQQWDFPNEWAPLQSFLIEGLRRTGNTQANKIALELAKIWIKNAYVGFKKNGYMYEKYNAIEVGRKGASSGSHTAQTGFGWTNGLCMILFDIYKNDLKSSDYDDIVSLK